MVVSSVSGLFQTGTTAAAVVGILLAPAQAVEAGGPIVELAEQAIERAVLEHQHDDVISGPRNHLLPNFSKSL